MPTNGRDRLSMRSIAFRATLCAFALAALHVPAAARIDGPSPIGQLKTFRFGPDRSVLDAVARWVAQARRDPAQRRQAAAELASVLDSDAAFDARQFACRQLVVVGGTAQIPSLLRTLDDPQLAHYGLMALARIPGAPVDQALRKELSRRSGLALAEVIDVLGERRDASAVSAIAARIASRDPAVADAAASALAKIADAQSLAALRQAYRRASSDRRLALGDALIRCVRRRGDIPAEALPIYTMLDAQRAAPALSAAGLRGLAQIRGAASVPILLAALRERGSLRQKMAAKLLRQIPGARVTALLSAALPTLSGPTQMLLVEVLADRRDPAAAPAIIHLARNGSDDAKVAALRALGPLSNPLAVPVLLDAVAKGMPDERDAATDSLGRMRGKAIDEAILAAADTSARDVRVAAIETLGRRRVAGQEARLLQTAGAADPEVADAAFRVLRTLGAPSSLPALTRLMLARPAGKRDAAIAAISEIARRGAAEAERTGALLAALATATRPADRVDLLGILAEVGGPSACAALRQALADPSADVQLAALSALAEWPTDEPLSDLLQIARTSDDAARRSIALRGYTRMVGANELRPVDETIALYRNASSLARSPAERKLIVAGLAKVRGLGALQYAAELRKDPDVRPEAELALVEIARSTLGAYRDETRAVLEPIVASAEDPEVRRQASALLGIIPKLGDFVTAWEVSPAYQQDGANYAALFDIPFPPELPDQASRVPWRLMPAGTNPDQPWLLDLLALYGGEQKVAYLRTAVWSDAERDLVLESGSDDGTNAWWNGQVVISVNVQRAVAPAQERTRLRAKAGWNQLMMKIPQNVMGWGACARFTNVDGTPAEGLRFAPPSAVR